MLGRTALRSTRAVLEVYARNEAALEAGEYLPYCEIVARA